MCTSLGSYPESLVARGQARLFGVAGFKSAWKREYFAVRQHRLCLLSRGYKDGLQPESLDDGNWLVKQNHPVSKIETKSDTNLRSLYES